MAADVAVEGCRKTYGDVVAVDTVDLTVAAGEFFTLLGPSGSGKTTTLRMIAGFEQPDTGRIMLGGEDITRMPPYTRDVNTVFQDYALFPHMTVAENVGYGLKVKGVPRATRKQQVAEVLDMVRLGGYGDRKPVQLSGGQRQRVALARSIVNRPKVLLLDEPLGALDLKLRQEMQIFLKSLQRELGMTFIYVTHDQEEALTMSDHLAVFNEGRIEQVGAPDAVYEQPATEFVAGFVGTSNIIERNGRRISIRPERIELNGTGVAATVADVIFVGAFRRILVDTDAGDRLTVVRPNDGSTIEPGSRVRVAWRDAGRLRTPTPQHPGGQMTKRMWALLATLAVAAAFPAAGATKQTGGTLNMIAWEGYLQPQWVKPFTKATGCTIHAKYGGSSDEMVTLMRSGGGNQYDMVSASGDASLRLIYGKDVQTGRPVEDPRLQELRPGVQVAAEQHRRRQALRHLAAVGTEHAPLQHEVGQARSDVMGVDLQREVQGQGHRPRQPDSDRRRGAVPDEDERVARDQGSVRAQPDPVQRGDLAPQEAEAADQEVLGARIGRDQPVQERRRCHRCVVAVSDEHADRGQGTGEGPGAEGGRNGLARHVDGLREDEEPRLRVQVARVDLHAEGAGAAGDLLR